MATLIGLAGNDFFWELVTLIDIMLLGHWIEMKSVMGAGKALEKLAALIPDTAHLLNSDGSTQEIAVSTLKGGEQRALAVGAEAPSLLAGLIVDADGSRMAPTHATKKAKSLAFIG